MENEVSFPKEADGRTVLPMSPFPLFIKGMPGTEKQLCEAIANAAAAATDTGAVDVFAFPTAAGKAFVVFKNNVSKDFKGEAKIVLNGTESKLSLQLAPLSQKEESVGLKQASDEYGKLLPFDFACSVNGGSLKNISGRICCLKTMAMQG